MKFFIFTIWLFSPGFMRANDKKFEPMENKGINKYQRLGKIEAELVRLGNKVNDLENKVQNLERQVLENKDERTKKE